MGRINKEKSGRTTKVYEGKTSCPHCGKDLEIKLERETVVPSEPAETQMRLSVYKDDQVKLGEEEEVEIN